jgi:hypothetical protein
MLEIQLPRQTLFLTEQELTSLLAKDLDLWKLALKRGKGILRQRQARSRVPKHILRAEYELAEVVAAMTDREL